MMISSKLFNLTARSFIPCTGQSCAVAMNKGRKSRMSHAKLSIYEASEELFKKEKLGRKASFPEKLWVMLSHESKSVITWTR